MQHPQPPGGDSNPSDRLPYGCEFDTLELEAQFLSALNLPKSDPSTNELLNRLRRSSTEWRATVDALDELIFMVDKHGKILRTNRAVEHWGLGSVRKVLMQPFHETVHPDCHDPYCYLKRAWCALAAQDQPSGPRVVETEDRELKRFVEATLHRIVDTESSPESAASRSFAVVVLRDSTEIHRKRMQRWHRDQSETLETVVRGLAHEIGNPLAAMKTSLQVLNGNFDTFDDEKKRLYLRRILEGTDRIWSIVDQVLRQGGRQIGALEAVPAMSTLGRIMDRFADQASTSEVQLKAVKGDTDLILRADPRALDEVLTNLYKNALEACSPGDWIQVELCEEADRGHLVLQDSGCGIEPHDLRKVFQPFFTTKARGSGIGMTHVAHLMQQMGGSIEVDSCPRVGTKVRLTFLKNPQDGNAM